MSQITLAHDGAASTTAPSTPLIREEYFKTLDDLLRACEREAAMLPEDRLLAQSKIAAWVAPRLEFLARAAREHPCWAPPWRMTIVVATGETSTTSDPDPHPCEPECVNAWYRDWLTARGRRTFYAAAQSAESVPTAAETS